MSAEKGGWKPTPVNQSVAGDNWKLDLNALRLEIFYAKSPLEADAHEKVFLALVDEWGRIYPRERALIVIERLLAFYNSVTDDRLDQYNSDIEGTEGGKAVLRMRLDRVLAENRKVEKNSPS